MAAAHSSLDGRANLSESALVSLVTWFCRVAPDQLKFMSGLFWFDALSARIAVYVQKTLALGEQADATQEVLRRGKIARGEAARITGRPERSARVIVESAAELFPRLFVAG